MGASNSRLEEDKGLQLCRARKRFVKQALNGRSSLAAAHIAYIEQLKLIGAALRRFLEPDNALIDNSVSPSSFSSHPMQFGVTMSTKIEEKPPELSVLEAHSIPSDGAPPWDYFGPMNDHDYQGSNEIPYLEDVESHESEDEFDEPSSASLVRSFKNVNTTEDGVLSIRPSESVILENTFANGKTNSAPDLSPIRGESSKDVKIVAREEMKVASKDLFSSINDVEQLFVKASESGKEVPRMLEANKFHFRPAFPMKERGSISSPLLKSCFSCAKDPSEVQHDPPQNSVKYLTWHRTTSFRSASSRDLLTANSADDPNNLFDNFCMVSGSHASTLDRLYAWEKKLYDEVKASQVIKSNFDRKCKLLRQKESRGQNADKTRAAVKDLYSRIRVAIHRINSISKKIEEIRDIELQPQLEELIEGLRKMWEVMMECHKLQSHIISISHTNTKMRLDSQRQITISLGHELTALSSIFTKWIAAQKTYVEAIDKWLFKCVSLQQNPSKRNKRMKPPILRNCGPPIYMICSAWLEMIGELPREGVIDSIRALAAQVARFLPRHGTKSDRDGDVVRDEGVEHLIGFRTSLSGFLAQLNSFAECLLNKFTELQKAIQDSKTNYEHFMLQRSQVFV